MCQTLHGDRSFLFHFSEKSDLEGIAAAKIKQITADLEAAGSRDIDPAERMKTGFIQFRTEKYEYVH